LVKCTNYEAPHYVAAVAESVELLLYYLYINSNDSLKEITIQDNELKGLANLRQQQDECSVLMRLPLKLRQ